VLFAARGAVESAGFLSAAARASVGAARLTNWGVLRTPPEWGACCSGTPVLWVVAPRWHCGHSR